jgi:hypothetical protein
MMKETGAQTLKTIISEALHLSRDALHIYVGLGVFLIIAALLHKPLRSTTPWFSVVIAAIAGEIVDGYDDVVRDGYWHWPESIHDFLNTLFWPTILLLLARFGIFFRQSSNN